jgi:transcriptional regulator with XRE-family HTH domain
VTARTWEEVGALVRDRRIELGLTQEGVARDGGLSVATWRLLEQGGRDRYQQLTLSGAARALGWPHDAILRLLDGVELAALGAIDRPRTTEPAADAGAPTGLSKKWSELTAQERARVEAFIDGILSTRG